MTDYPTIRSIYSYLDSPIYQPFAHIPTQSGYIYDLPPLSEDGNVQELNFEKEERQYE